MNEHNNKKCSKCKETKTLENFTNGKACCQKCCEYKQQYREYHREELRQKAKEYYEKYREQKLEKHKEKVEGPICKTVVSTSAMLRHKNTQRH